MPTRAGRIEELFQAALDLDPAQRRGFLAAACRGDEEMRGEVEALLAIDARSDRRLDQGVPAALALGPAPASLLIGRRLGCYTLRRCLGSGGMATVYEAIQANPRRRVAVKVLRAELVSDELARRFRVEASFLARLQHPHIAQVFGADVATVDGVRIPYIAMELVRAARPITTFAAERSLSLRARIELIADVCDAVQHGHQRGVIHRDLKPQNILVGDDGRPKLIDFGVARAVGPGAGTRRTRVGTFLGTVAYMSPEHSVDARDLDVRSDVYSLGVVLYELVCGRLPYDLAGLPLAQAARIVQERPPCRPSAVQAELRGDLETILLETLAKDRGRRYQTAAALAGDLRRYLRREPITARPPSWRYRSALLVRRHKVLAGALALVVLVTVAAFVVSIRFAFDERRARVHQELASYLASVAAAAASLRVHDAAGARAHLLRAPASRRGWEWWYLEGRLELAQRCYRGPLARCGAAVWVEGLLATLWWSVDERWQVSLLDASTFVERAHSPVLSDAQETLALTRDGLVVWGQQRLHVWNPHSGRVTDLPALHRGPIRAIRATGSGRILSASSDGSVRLWDPLRAAPIRTVLEGTVPWRALAVAPARDRIALGGADGSVYEVGLESGAGRRLLGRHGRAVTSVAFDGSGRRLASGSEDATVRVFDLDSGRELRRLIGHESEVRDVAFLPGQDLLASASNDGTVRIWDVASGMPRNVLYGHENWVVCLAVGPGGRHLASGAYDGTVRLWDPWIEPAGRAIGGFRQIVRDLAFTPDGKELVAASRDGTLRILETGSFRERSRFDGPGGRVWSVAVDPTGSWIAAGADAPWVRVYDRATGRLVRELGGFSKGIASVSFAPAGRRLAAGSTDGRVIVYEGEDLQEVLRLRHQAEIRHLAFSPKGDLLAVTADKGRLWLHALPGGRVVWDNEAATRIHSVAFAPGGRAIVTGTGDYDGSGLGVRFRDVATGRPIRRFAGHTEVVYDTDFSPDGRRMATASADATVRLWDVASGEEVLVLRGHESWVFCVAFSPDGRYLASGGGNYGGTGAGIRIWESARR